jgi:tetratricopeptide (TPR) repeat protein
MMIALKEALPSLGEFDGVTLTRAYHDAKNQLVITATAIGEADAKRLEPELKRLLQTHLRWRVRTEKGFVFEITDRRAGDYDLSQRLITRALHLLQVTIGEARVEKAPPTRNGWWNHAWPFDDRLPPERPTAEEYDRAIEYLDASLSHYQKDSLAWYLRGYCYLARGRTDLARRDLRRMVQMEESDRDLRHTRIVQLELVQGKIRQAAFEIERESIVEVSNGWTLRNLPESPVAKDTAR